MLAGLLGFLSDKQVGAMFLSMLAACASLACLIGFWCLGWDGLLIAVFIVAVLGYQLGRRFGKHRGGLFVAFLWYCYCAACAAGYWRAGLLGWFTITLPGVLLFCYSLWRLSEQLLPIHRQSWQLLRDLWRRMIEPRPLDNDEQRQKRQRYQSFRALVTCYLGTNYPYYTVEDGQPVKRIDGNPYGRFFAGPGIVITEPHQAAVITTGIEVKEIAAPGLTFTGLFDGVDQIVDLRPQLKAFDVEAVTRDGIPIRVLCFVHFKIRTRDLPPGRFWTDDESREAIFQLVHAQPVGQVERRYWDDLAPMVAARVLRDIIGRYQSSELCGHDRPDRTADEEILRKKILREFSAQLTDAMATRYKGVQILGADIANVERADGKPIAV